MEFKCCKGCGKKCWIVLAVVAAIILAVALGIYIYTNSVFTNNVAQEGGVGDCLILSQEYCDVAQILPVDAQGAKAATFNLPVGTPIYMPFDGIYTDGSFEGKTNEVITLSIPNTNSVVTVVGGYAPSFASGASVSKGQQLAVTAKTTGEAKAFNFVVYTENYDITNLFK